MPFLTNNDPTLQIKAICSDPPLYNGNEYRGQGEVIRYPYLDMSKYPTGYYQVISDHLILRGHQGSQVKGFFLETGINLYFLNSNVEGKIDRVQPWYSSSYESIPHEDLKQEIQTFLREYPAYTLFQFITKPFQMWFKVPTIEELKTL